MIWWFQLSRERDEKVTWVCFETSNDHFWKKEKKYFLVKKQEEPSTLYSLLTLT